MKSKLIILLLCVFTSFNCQMEKSLKNRLRQRVNLYHTHLIKSEYALSWDYLWHDAKRRRNRDEWSLFCQKSDLESKLIEFHIKSIAISKVKKQSYLAKVKLIGKNKLIKQNKIENAEGEDEWVFENGDWFRYID
jgi:hypothetical protein